MYVPSSLTVSPIVLVAFWALDVIYPPHFAVFLFFWMHWQGSQGVDRFMVHWYVVALENPCQLFSKLNNVGQTYAIYIYVVFYWFI